MIEFAAHAGNPDFDIVNGVLTCQGESLEALYRDRNQPGYFYFRDLVDARLATLRQHLPDALKLHYAIKANPHPELVRHIAPRVDGLDVASGRELELALTTQTPVSEISFAGPGKSPDEIAAAVRAGITLNAESTTEIGRADAVAGDDGLAAQVAVRVNPDFELKASGMKMAGGPKPFGIDAELVPEILRSFPAHADFRGFHIFSGSQNLQEEAIIESQQKAVALALALTAHAPNDPAYVNIGGGFGIPYFPGDKPLDLAVLGAALDELLGEFHKALPETDMVIELGRYIVGAAGVYLCEVVDKKVSRGQTYLVTNGGLHHHLALSGNFGQVIRKNYPVAIANRMDDDDVEPMEIVGPLCTPLDILGASMPLPSATDIGDVVAVFQSGAYGFTASPRSFLSHPEPIEVLVA